LLLTADVVDRQLEGYLELHGIQPSWGTQERILVCMTPRANAAAMLASGRRNADRFHGELFAIYVSQPNLTPEDRSALARNVTLARAQQAGTFAAATIELERGGAQWEGQKGAPGRFLRGARAIGAVARHKRMPPSSPLPLHLPLEPK